MVEAFGKLKEKYNWERLPIVDFLAATSVGIVGQELVLDLNYAEDSSAIVDMNIVMTGKGQFVELQGTGEESPFSYEQLQGLIELGKKGVLELISHQKQALGPLIALVGNGE